MIADAQGVRHDRERGIYRAARTEEAAVHDIEIVEFVSFAVPVERARFWIFTKTNCSVLMRDTSERNALTEK